MSATKMYPQLSEEGFFGSTYMKTGKMLTTSCCCRSLLYQLSSWLIFSLGKSINPVIGESSTTPSNQFYSLISIY